MKNKTIKAWQVVFLLLLIAGTVYVSVRQKDVPYYENKGFVFGTTYSVAYQHDEDLKKEIEEELAKVDLALSPFNKQSVITAVNENRETELSEMFTDVFTLAQTVSEDTEGAFDITVAPMVNAWGFGFKTGNPPTAQQVDSLKELVGYRKVTLKNGKIRKTDKRISLDCSAIAKGYGSDVVARFLRSKGIKNFMVEIGGEVVTCGINPKRMPWRIGVTKPTDDSLAVSHDLQTVLNVTDIAMATSGNYRNFYYKDGKKYAHTIDPASGYPVQHSLLSATVLAKDCATADAYATSFMVMGMEKAKEVLKRHPDMMAYFIYSGNKGETKVWFSPALEKKIMK